MECAKQSFSIDATAVGMITSASGTEITFYAYSFINGMAQDVTAIISIELVEIFNKCEDLTSNPWVIFPCGGLRPLLSGGEFKIGAFQNDTALSLKSGVSYNVIYNAPGGVADPNIQLSYGNEVGDTLTWDPQDTLNNAGVFAEGSQYYSFLDRLNWINCDYFMDYNGPLTTVSAELPTGFTSRMPCYLFLLMV